MKRTLLISILGVCLGAFVNAQEYWIEEDFSTDAWQSEVRAFVDDWNADNPDAATPKVFPEEGATAANVGFADGGSEINGYLLDGAYVYDNLGRKCVEDENVSHTYSFRLRSSGVSVLRFPVVENAGNLYVHLRNGNAANATTITLQKYDNDSYAWSDVETKDVQATDNYPGGGATQQDEIVVFNLDETSPVELQLSRGNNNRFIMIYKIALEKNGENSVKSTFSDNVNFYVSNKTAYVAGNVKNAKISVYDLSGKSILESMLEGNSISLASLQAGTYIIKLTSAEGTLTKKIAL